MFIVHLCVYVLNSKQTNQNENFYTKSILILIAPQLAEKLHDMKKKKGDTVTLTAKFLADTETPNVSWKREGREIVQSKRAVISCSEDTVHLKLLNLQLDDTGRYTVRLENQHGAVECSSQLIVRGKIS